MYFGKIQHIICMDRHWTFCVQTLPALTPCAASAPFQLHMLQFVHFHMLQFPHYTWWPQGRWVSPCTAPSNLCTFRSCWAHSHSLLRAPHGVPHSHSRPQKPPHSQCRDCQRPQQGSVCLLSEAGPGEKLQKLTSSLPLVVSDWICDTKWNQPFNVTFYAD